MRYVYVDLGCYDGDSVREFYKWAELKTGVPYKDFEIFAFDPNPRYGHIWEEMEAENPKLKFHNKAAYSHDGLIEYTLRPENAPLGSTVMKTKRDWGAGDILTVPCFNFSKWLRQFSPSDCVIVKMDIEGAEYTVLKKILEDENDDRITQLFVEWHDSKMSSDNGQLQERLIRELRCEVLPWD